MRKSMIAFFCMAFLLLTNCAGPKSIMKPATPTPLSVAEILAQLNDWDLEDMDILECPNRYPPGYVASGEASAWIHIDKLKLRDLGVYVRWNCKISAFEITTKDDVSPECGCPRLNE